MQPALEERQADGTARIRRAGQKARRREGKRFDDELLFAPELCGMLDELWEPGIAVRLVGVSVSGFSEPEGEQGSLFDVKQVAPLEGDAKPRIQDESKRRGLLAATDLVKDRFGEGAVRFGHELRNDGNTTGTAAKNPADYK